MPEEAYLIGTVGRLHPVKGHGDLVAALGLLAQSEEPPHVAIVGYAPEEERQKLVEQARALGVERLLHFAGRRENIPEWLAAVDAFVLPSHSEGMPNALLEAMAAGLPAVATRVGGRWKWWRRGRRLCSCRRMSRGRWRKRWIRCGATPRGRRSWGERRGRRWRSGPGRRWWRGTRTCSSVENFLQSD